MFDKIKTFDCYQKGDVNDAIISAAREYIPIYLIRQEGSLAEFVSKTQLKTDFDNMTKLFKSDVLVLKFDKGVQIDAPQNLNDIHHVNGILSSLIMMRARYTKVDMYHCVIYFESNQGTGHLHFYNNEGGLHIYE